MTTWWTAQHESHGILETIYIWVSGEPTYAPLRTSQDLLEDIGIVILQRVETISDTNIVELGMIPAIIPCSKIGTFWAWIVGRSYNTKYIPPCSVLNMRSISFATFNRFLSLSLLICPWLVSKCLDLPPSRVGRSEGKMGVAQHKKNVLLYWSNASYTTEYGVRSSMSGSKILEFVAKTR